VDDKEARLQRRREYAARYRARNRDRFREWQRQYVARHPEYNLRTPEFRAKRAAESRERYSRDRERILANHRRYRERNRDKERARTTYKAALQAGRIDRPDHCSRCQKPCVPHGHHPDYARPLDVVWLCRDCHWIEHHPEARSMEKRKKARRAA